MLINALNSGAYTFMADLEDSIAPTWQNLLNSHINLYDAIRRQVDFKNDAGKEYKLNQKSAVLILRPRGWHLDEAHITVDGQPMSGSLADFGLYFFHNAKEQVKRGLGPYFYLPKMESHLEARLWNDVFNLSQDYIGMPRGTIRGTVLIETMPAVFEMDEIIYELRQHSSGLNCGRWDFIFSYLKKLSMNKNWVLNDRSSITMTVPFMDSYVKLLINTCHKRGVHAMGGMAAQIPIKGDQKANDAAMDKVTADKLREVTYGHDGTWVAHPALCQLALKVFNDKMPTPNQIFRRREEWAGTKAMDLLNTNVPGAITEAGIRSNAAVGLGYVEAWLRGIGCVPLNFMMEDAATAEISRAQLWQLAHHSGIRLQDGREVTTPFLNTVIEEEASKMAKANAKNEKSINEAKQYLLGQLKADRMDDFLTSALYSRITKTGPPAKL